MTRAEDSKMLSIATDYAAGTGNPQPYLRRIADAGFSHVHWCHQWNTDFLYSEPEVAHIGRTLNDYGLRLLDLHASCGREKDWASALEHERLAGVELVKNRIAMAVRLGSDVIVMHALQDSEPLRRSLDEIRPYARARHVRIAVENGDFSVIERLFEAYDDAYLGLCYDAGHGNIVGANGNVPGRMGWDHLDRFKGRLIAVHLHDNDGHGDQHMPPFSGTVDWGRLARLIARSAYTKALNLEVSLHNSGLTDEACFLEEVFRRGSALTRMVDDHREREAR